MGYCLSAFAVDLDQASKAIGSKDEKLLALILEDFESEFDQYDEMAADRCEDDDDPPLTMRDVMSQMILGDSYDQRLGFMYGYALEFICGHYGKMLPNEQWSAMPSGAKWSKTVNEALEQLGVNTSRIRLLDELLYRGPPARIPEIDDFPGIGYLRLAEIKEAGARLQPSVVDSIKDTEVKSSIEEMLSWLRYCVETKLDLITFMA